MSQRPNKLLDLVRDAIQRKHYSYHTERCYVEWIRHFILFHDKKHQKSMGITPYLRKRTTSPALDHPELEENNLLCVP